MSLRIDCPFSEAIPKVIDSVRHSLVRRMGTLIPLDHTGARPPRPCPAEDHILQFGEPSAAFGHPSARGKNRSDTPGSGQRLARCAATVAIGRVEARPSPLYRQCLEALRLWRRFPTPDSDYRV